MTLGAVGIDVRAGQREVRIIVIECRRLPGRRAVALIAGMTELPGDVVGIFHPFIVRLVTRPAVGRRTCILPVPVTFGTAYRDVRTRQRKITEIVIEGRRSPAENRMALPARVRVVARHVIGVAHAFKVILVASVTLRWRAIKLSIDVTRCAINGDVSPEQGESSAVMIECGRFPSRCVMALSTSVRELSLDVIIGFLIVRLVAGPTIRRCVVVLAVGVTLHAACRNMGARERELRLIMVK